LEKIKLDIGFCFYEDSLDTVRRAIESVRYHVRYIFAIDGKFNFLNSNKILSESDVRAYLKSVPNVILIDAPNLGEVAKRTEYLYLCKTHHTEAMIILDSDEWVDSKTEWDKVYNSINLMRPKEDIPRVVALRMDTHGGGGWFPKVWLNPGLIKYTKCHNFWTHPDGTLWKSTGAYPRMEGLYLGTNDYLRSDHIIDVTLQYQKKLIAYEKPFKKIYMINARRG